MSKKADSSSQRIECNVTKCAHNCIDDSTCRLDAIKVCTCSNQRKGNLEDETACASYHYAGYLNEEEIKGRD